VIVTQQTAVLGMFLSYIVFI